MFSEPIRSNDPYMYKFDLHGRTIAVPRTPFCKVGAVVEKGESRKGESEQKANTILVL